MDFIPAKHIITATPSVNDWFGCEYNMNIYRGCCHGCIYCDSRSDCYRVENFDTVRAKASALSTIERELSAKRKSGIIGTGAMSDPYNPFEAEHKLTRGALQLIDKYSFGINMLTKSSLVTRDIDLYQSIARHSPSCVKLTITTADDNLCRVIEPHVAVTSERFAALAQLARSGITTGVLIMPILPLINDTEQNIADIVEGARRCGVRFIYPAFGVTLRQNQRAYFYDKLDILFPGLKQRYIQTFGNTYGCISPDSNNLWSLFTRLCDQYGIVYRMDDIISVIRRGYENRQQRLPI